MKEYSVLAAAAVFLAVLLDAASGVRLLQKKEFYLYLFLILFFKLLVNGYLTGARIVLYNPKFFFGIRVGSIPLEDFFFGFSMVTTTIVFWEFFIKRQG